MPSTKVSTNYQLYCVAIEVALKNASAGVSGGIPYIPIITYQLTAEQRKPDPRAELKGLESDNNVIPLRGYGRVSRFTILPDSGLSSWTSFINP